MKYKKIANISLYALLGACLIYSTSGFTTVSSVSETASQAAQKETSEQQIKQYNQKEYLKILKNKTPAVESALNSVNTDGLRYNGNDQRLKEASDSIKNNYNLLGKYNYDNLSNNIEKGEYTYPSMTNSSYKLNDDETSKYLDSLITPIINGLKNSNDNYVNVVNTEKAEAEEAAKEAAAAEAAAKASASGTASKVTSYDSATHTVKKVTTTRNSNGTYSSHVYTINVGSTGCNTLESCQNAVNSTSGATDFSQYTSGYDGKTVIGQHNYQGGYSFPSTVGSIVKLTGSYAGTYQVVNQVTGNNHHDNSTLSGGDVYYQTCIGNGVMRWVALKRIG